MRSVIVVTCLLVLACTGPSGPDEALVGFFDALQAGRGERAVSSLTSDAIETLAEGINLEGMRTNPDSSASLLASYGMGITSEELRSISPRSFMVRFASSPLLTSLLQEARLTTGAFLIEGPRASVDVTVFFLGDSSRGTVEMRLEENRWKITCEGTRFAFN